MIPFPPNPTPHPAGGVLGNAAVLPAADRGDRRGIAPQHEAHRRGAAGQTPGSEENRREPPRTHPPTHPPPQPHANKQPFWRRKPQKCGNCGLNIHAPGMRGRGANNGAGFFTPYLFFSFSLSPFVLRGHAPSPLPAHHNCAQNKSLRAEYNAIPSCGTEIIPDQRFVFIPQPNKEIPKWVREVLDVTVFSEPPATRFWPEIQ